MRHYTGWLIQNPPLFIFEGIDVTPPLVGFFKLLNGSNFLLLNGTNFLLL